MIIISAGFRKSASTLIYDFKLDLVKNLSIRTGQAKMEEFSSGRNRAYRGKLNLKTFLILLYVNIFYGDVVLKTHGGPTIFTQLLVALGIAKIIYTYREPRDVALSMMDHGKRTRQEIELGHEEQSFLGGFRDVYNSKDALKYIKEDVDAWRKWEKFKQTMIIRYEDMIVDKHSTLSSIAVHLGYNPNEKKVSSIINKYIEFKNKNFNKGSTKRYRDEMNLEDRDLYLEVIGKDLIDMGYLDKPKSSAQPKINLIN